MIRVNLLEGTAEQRVSVQKTKVAARRGQQIVHGRRARWYGLLIAIGVDHLWTNNAQAEAQSDARPEEEEAKKLEGRHQAQERARSRAETSRGTHQGHQAASSRAKRPGGDDVSHQRAHARRAGRLPSRQRSSKKALTFRSSAARSISRSSPTSRGSSSSRTDCSQM